MRCSAPHYTSPQPDTTLLPLWLVPDKSPTTVGSRRAFLNSSLLASLLQRPTTYSRLTATAMSQRFTVERRPSDIQGEVNQLFEGDEPPTSSDGGGGGSVDGGGGGGGSGDGGGAGGAEAEVAEVVVVLKGRRTVYRRFHTHTRPHLFATPLVSPQANGGNACLALYDCMCASACVFYVTVACCVCVWLELLMNLFGPCGGMHGRQEITPTPCSRPYRWSVQSVGSCILQPYMSCQFLLLMRLRPYFGESYTSPAAANLKGIRVSGRCGRAVTGLPLIKREMSMSRVGKGVLMLGQHQFSSRPWLCFVIGTCLPRCGGRFTWVKWFTVLSRVVPIWVKQRWTNGCGESHQVLAWKALPLQIISVWKK